MNGTLLGLALSLPLLVLACASDSAPREAEQASFRELRDRYVHELLRRNPVTCTYLGGEGLFPDLATVNGRLRDYSAAALEEENRFYRTVQDRLATLATDGLAPEERIDAHVMRAQIGFMLRLTETRRHQEVCLDSYTSEAPRGIDWQIQGMAKAPGGGIGTEAEWRLVASRIAAVPSYLAAARKNLEQGIAREHVPDVRMVERDGIGASEANAKFLESTLPEQAKRFLQGEAYRDGVARELAREGTRAAAAFRDFATWLRSAFAEGSAAGRLARSGNRFAMGEAEYDHALEHNLQVRWKAKDLFTHGQEKVRETQRLMVETAGRVAKARAIPWSEENEDAARASVRRVMDALAQGNSPKDDEEMVAWYRAKSQDLVAYGRAQDLFDLPADYRLDVVETPPQLRSAIEGAAYYPSPPFKKTGVGRFYLTPTGNDAALLAENNRFALAYLCAHEGFPGHDWHYQYMNAHSSRISPVRWLTPGAVEDSSSMWEDSMAAEGWALYCEALMAEPAKGKSDGFYLPEERLYQLQGQLMRDIRVRVDPGIHCGWMSFDEAVTYFAEEMFFLPRGASKRSDSMAESARAAFKSADRAIYRYSKWPTQAVTYYIGKREILDLRELARRELGAKYSAKRFHEAFMEQGTIPSGYFAERLLAALSEGPSR